MRLLFVTPRWGEVAGGAERAMRGFATRCCDGYDVEVATTCAVDHHTWRNELPAGVERDGDVTVRRFEVTQRGGHTPGHVGSSYLGQVRALSASVWSEPMQRFLLEEAERFDAILLAPYLFGTTFWSAAAQPARALLVPCLHDEREARTAPMRALLGPGARLHLPLPRRGGARAPAGAGALRAASSASASTSRRRSTTPGWPRSAPRWASSARTSCRSAGSRRASASTPSST